MTYEQVRTLKPEAFKRFCGVQATTFSEMVTALKQKQQEKRKTGRPAKLSLEDQVQRDVAIRRESTAPTFTLPKAGISMNPRRSESFGTSSRP